MTSDIEVAEALEALNDIAEWTRTTDQWRMIDRILIAMITALPAAPAELTARLELASPHRVPRIGRPNDTDEVPPPPSVRERRNQLIDAFQDRRQERGNDRTNPNKREI